METTQYRSFDITCRKLEEENKQSYEVEGYATTFNEPYCLGENDKFKVSEQVDQKAFDEAQMNDVIFQYDHEGRVYARMTNGTLKLTKDENGLKVWADLGGTSEGRKLYEEIKGGYTTKMSFAFIVSEDEESRSKTENGKTEFLRAIKKISRVFDVSAVSLPANDKTTISARSFTENIFEKLASEKRAEEKETQEEKNTEDLQKQRERFAEEISYELI